MAINSHWRKRYILYNHEWCVVKQLHKITQSLRIWYAETSQDLSVLRQ